MSHVSDDGEEKLIAYASRSLSVSRQNYSMIKKEALAIVLALRNSFSTCLEDVFSLLMDHRPLTLLLGSKHGIPVLAASRLQRWAIQLFAYQTSMTEYRASKDHANANALSRWPRKTVEEPYDWSIKADEVNRVQMEQAPITVSNLRGRTWGSSPLSCDALYFVLLWLASRKMHSR